MMLYVVLLAVVIGCMVALSKCDRPVATATITPSGGDTLDIAIEYSPITYYTYDDTLGGCNYDLLRLVAHVPHRPMTFHPIVSLHKALDGLNSGAYDLMVAQFPTTAQNRAKYIFTDPIYIDQQVLVQRSNTGIRSQLELGGDTVHVVKGSPMVERIAGLSREIGDTIHVITDATYGPEQLVMMVAAGDIKLAVVNKSIALALAQRLPQLDISIDISLSQFQAWTLAKDNAALRDSINRWLKAVPQQQRQALQQRYFVPPTGTKH